MTVTLKQERSSSVQYERLGDEFERLVKEAIKRSHPESHEWSVDLSVPRGLFGQYADRIFGDLLTCNDGAFKHQLVIEIERECRRRLGGDLLLVSPADTFLEGNAGMPSDDPSELSELNFRLRVTERSTAA